jgi:hypothetical protein
VRLGNFQLRIVGKVQQTQHGIKFVRDYFSPQVVFKNKYSILILLIKAIENDEEVVLLLNEVH